MSDIFHLETSRAALKLPEMAQLVRVEPIELLPTQAGCAAFLSNGEKAILIHIDPAIGATINFALAGQHAARPLTHDLYHSTLQAFGAKVTRAVIVDLIDEVYHARLIIEAENEIMERKIVELDARPSDCIALSVRCGAPLYVADALWRSLPDMMGVLAEMRQAENRDEN
jgi:bifunctional DNase/RNase